ncbi:MAG: M50 family metallopeptidase [Candidatus Paceibacterota bacterium]|jgi:regulator of sigma E protease
MIILAVVIGLIILVIAHEFGHFIASKAFGVKVEEFGVGYPPKLFGKKFGETLYSVNLLPLGGFVRIHGEEEHAEEGAEPIDPQRSFVHQAIWKRSFILIAGVVMNLIAGWLIFSGVFMTGSPEHLILGEIDAKSPAAIAGLMRGDVITFAKLGELELKDPVQIKEFIGAVKRVAGTEVTIEVMREGKTIETKLTPRITPPEGEGALGVELIEMGFVAKPFFAALGAGFVAMASVLWLTILGFANLFVSLFVAPSTALQSVAGPVGIFTLAAQTGEMGFVYLAQLIGFISVNLAVLNLIPFPALDGGRVLFLCIEKIKGSPISSRTQRIINGVGFLALLALMVLVTVHDVGKISR